MKLKSTLRSFLALASSSLLAISYTQAADGTWTQTTAGPFNWGDIANWNNGTGPIASDQDSTAFFTADISAAQTLTLDSNRTLGSLVFDDLVSSHNLTISGGSILTLDRATGVPVINVAQSGRTLAINSQISGNDGLRKIGSGLLTLGGTNDYTGGTFLSGGTLTLANTGSLTSGSALTFDSTTTFNSIRLAAGSQTLGALTLNSGDATITSTAAGASSAATLTFGSLATRPVGATANFTLATNTTAATNNIVFTATTNVPLASGSNDAGIFFGGSTYARYDAGGYVRATTYGTDSNANAALSGLQVTLGAISASTDVRFSAAVTTTSTASAQAAASTLTVADGTLFNVGQAISGTGITANTYITGIAGNILTLNQNTGTVAASAVITPYTLVTGQTTGSVNTVVLNGAGASMRLADSETLSVNGILRSGGTANIISTMTGGTGIQTATSGGDLVLRTDVANDVVRVTTPILNNGGSSLTKSGAGTLTLTGNNTYTGSTTVNGGSLTMSGSNASSGGTVINAGTLTINGDTALGDVNGGITFNGNGSLLVSAATTLAATRTLTLNNGAISYLGDININAQGTLAINGKITGSGGIQASHYALGGSATVAATRLASTANDFTGPVILGGNTYSAFVLETASLADSAGAGNIIFSNGRNTAGDSATLQWGAGAIAGLTLNHRQLEIATTTGTANVISGVSNINANAANTVVINTDLKVSTTSARTFLLGGTNTGANTFAGDIADGVGAIGLTKDGSSTWVLSGNNTYTGTTTISAGFLKLDSANALPGGNLTIKGGGVVGLTANSGDFSRALGTTAGLVQFTGSGGFAAFGGTRTVSLGGGSINWSAANFIATGQTLILGSAVADGTVDWQQAISMAGQARTVQVNNGSATVDAIMSAAIGGGSSGVANGFTKTGIGTLAFTSNLNSYWGPTTVSNGTLTVGNGSTNGILSSNSATISVASGATLAVNRSNDVSQAVLGGLGNGAAVISGDGGFTQAGGGITTLTLTNTYLGATTVSNGTLRLGASNVLANTNVTIAAATLDVGAGFTDTVGTLDVTAAATINLGDSSSKLVFANSNLVDWTDTDPDGTLNITGAFVSGSSIKFATSVGLSAGQLASITLNGSPATFSLDGSGFLVSGGGPVGFAAWQAANGTLGDRSDDHDNDGVDNGTEHFIHGTVANSGFTALPGVDKALDGTLSVTWTKAGTYTGSYPTHYVVETSTTLAGPWTIETSPGNVSFPSANEVKYTFPGGPGYIGKIFARLKVTGP